MLNGRSAFTTSLQLSWSLTFQVMLVQRECKERADKLAGLAETFGELIRTPADVTATLERALWRMSAPKPPITSQ